MQKKTRETLLAKALLSHRPHKTLINKPSGVHFSCDTYAEWLIDRLPQGWNVTVVPDGKKCQTLKVFDRGNNLEDRIVFAQPGYKYQGYGVGRPQVRKMAAMLGVAEATFMQVQQDNKVGYHWNTNFDKLTHYLIRKYVDRT